MELVVHSRGLRLTTTMRERVERRVHFAFDRFADRLARIGVRFTDLNGPRGGEDKACTIAVTIRGLSVVHVSERCSDLRAALDVAVHRAARSVGRAIAREREALVDLLCAGSEPNWMAVESRSIRSSMRRRRALP